jgi:hypothetical protein
VIEAADYIVRVEEAQLRELGLHEPALRTAPARFLARDEVLSDVLRKRILKRVNLRPAVLDLAWTDPPAGLGRTIPGARYLYVRVTLAGSAHARPEEVAAAVLGRDPGFTSHHLTRTGFVLKEGEGRGEPAAVAPGQGTNTRLWAKAR